MFDKIIFKKKYGLLSKCISDNNIIKKLLNDKEFLEFYNLNQKLISKFLNIVNYDEDSVMKFIEDISIIKKEKFLNIFITLYNYGIEYGVDNIVKEISYSDILNMGYSIYGIEETVVNYFIKKYGEPKFKFNYMKLNLDNKKEIVRLIKDNNIRNFNDIYSFLLKVDNDFTMDKMLDKYINKNIYNVDLKKILGESYEDFIKIYFLKNVYSDKIIINRILEVENYELLKDILKLYGYNSYGYISSMIKKEDADKDIFLSKNIHPNYLVSLLYKYFSKSKLNYYYYSKLNFLSDIDAVRKFKEKHKDILEILTKLNYEYFKTLDIEERIKIQSYIKALDDKEKELMSNEIDEINKEMKDLFKKEYIDKISSSKIIIDKTTRQEIKDKDGKVHNVKVYELKDNEKFTFLITVMHKLARDGSITPNMYNRPAHKLTIDDPSNFTKELPNGSEIISTSLINDSHIGTFVGYAPDLIYCFSDIDYEDLLGISPTDACLSPSNNQDLELFNDKEPLSFYELMYKTREPNFFGDYNEIAIRRKNKNGKIMPSAIICYNEINEVSIKHAEYFDIPIILINAKTYNNLKDKFKEEKKNSFY